MSVLQSRILAHGGGQAPGAAVHPSRMADTPTVLPASEIVVYPDLTAVYGTMHPLWTADGGVVGARSDRAVNGPYVGAVVPAGRP